MITQATSASAAAITLVGFPGQRQKIEQITWSYAAAPSGGRLSSTGLDGDELDIDITAGGPGGLALPRSSYGRPGQSVTVTLASGGTTAKLNVFSEAE